MDKFFKPLLGCEPERSMLQANTGIFPASYNADNVNDTELGENQTTGLVLRLYISFNFYSDLDC